MRFKYKKLIVGLTLGVMCIGFMTFSMMEPLGFPAGKKTKQETSKQEKVQETSAGTDTADVPIEGNEIQKSIEELIVRYMDAIQDVDMNAIEQCVTNISNIDEKRLLTYAEYIEDTQNISCTIMAGAKEGTYRVYVYYEYKLFNIETPSPGLKAFYIITEEDGTLRIYGDAMDSETQEYISRLDNSDTVKELSGSVQQKYNEALQSDEDLKNLYDMLENAGSDDE